MNTFTQFLKFRQLILFCGTFLLACSSDEPEAIPTSVPKTPTATVTVEELDDLSDHLEFLNANKIPGKIPAAPAGSSSLKISFKDTLYLMEDARIPIKILHDAATNVAGVYVQIHGPSTGTPGNAPHSTYHYDVPELVQTSESDTVTIILVAFDPDDFELPISFPVTIAPYDEAHQLLDGTEKIFTIESFDGSPISGRSKSEACEFTTPPVEGWWQWAYSLIEKDGEIVFYSSPDIVFGGQNIKGCCVNGTSDYGASCLQADPKYVNTLFFPTYYQIAGETFIFNLNGTFERITLERHGDPDTDNTNFCGVAYGAIRNTNEFVTYEGNWTLDQATQDLRLQTTTSSGSGYGNPGGIIRYNCHGIIMFQLDREGFGQNLEKFYFRMRPEDYFWYPID